MTCSNGHENALGSRFCAECGVPTGTDDTQLCAHGHRNPRQRKFCSDCGAPLAPPTASAADEPRGRWEVDPTARHDFRYLSGDVWTEHVADVGDGTFGTDSPSQRSKTRSPIEVLIGLVLVIVIVGAISAVALLFSRPEGQAASSVAPGEVVTQPTAAPPAEFLPTPTTYRPFAVIGAPCVPSTVNGVQRNGAVAYCELLVESNTYMWSSYWGAIESPYPPDSDPNNREAPGVAVCMMQLSLPREACIAQLPS